MADCKTQDDGHHDASGNPAVQKSVIRKGKQRKEHTAKDVGAFPRKPVGENTKERNGEEFDRGSQTHRAEHQSLIGAENDLPVGKHIRAEKIKTGILTEPAASCE